MKKDYTSNLQQRIRKHRRDRQPQYSNHNNDVNDKNGDEPEHTVYEKVDDHDKKGDNEAQTEHNDENGAYEDGKVDNDDNNIVSDYTNNEYNAHHD